MNNVPLINNLTVNDINTALIAIKKNLVKGANGNEQLQDVDVNVDVNIAQNCTYCAADSTTIKGAELFQGCSIKVLFTSAITGSNTTSPLTINYNNVDITVKVGKNGALADFIAYNTGSGYVYCQAYTTLELLFDGNNFVIMGNPVVISNSDYTVYTDGAITYSAKYINDNTFWNKCTKYFNSIPADFTTARNAYNSYVVKMLIVGNNHLMEEVQFSFSRNNETGVITTSNCYNLSGLASQASIRNENGEMVCTINTPTYGTAEVFYHKIY